MAENYNNIYAGILTGGLSSRIGGGIKSLKKFNDKTIFDRIFKNLKSQVPKIIVNSNDSEGLFLNYKVAIINDRIKGFLGPLAGIHALLEWINKNEKYIDWLITVPGDTPFIPNNLVKKLYNKAISNNFKIIHAKSNGKIHPVISIWHTSVYESLNEDLSLGVRKILDWSSKHSTSYVEFENPNYDPFFNINYNQDLIKAKEIENKNFLIC
tara:strand:+ start:48 stop:680 length:633 start_codon:yes stop_codon:yes gene_type:complete